MKIILSLVVVIAILSIPVASAMTMWSRTSAEIGIIGESPPVLCDVTGDGYKEIFWAGKPWNDRTNAYAHLVCVSGKTGNILWSKPYLQYWGDGNEMRHLPTMVYDFDKDGKYEVIAAGATICRDALTGEIKWQKPTNYFGWHNNAFIDYGTHVTLYTCGGGYVRRINGATGEIIGPNQVPITYTCWSGFGISDMNNDGNWEIAFGTRSTYGGLYLFDEELNIKWNIPSIFCSSQPPKMYDVDGDGYDEIIVAHQGGTNSKVHVVNYDGTYSTYGPFEGLKVHVSTTVGDVDGDGNMEWISCDSSAPIIIDLVTGQVEAIIPGSCFMPVSVADILPFPGNEIIIPQGTSTTRGIYRYDGMNYVKEGTVPSGTFNVVVDDVDNDGYKDILYSGEGGMSVWRTEVKTPYPEPLNLVAYGGMRRLNNNEYFPIPGTECPEIPDIPGFGFVVLLVGLISSFVLFFKSDELRKKK